MFQTLHVPATYWQASKASETLLSVENGKFQYIYRYVRHQNVERALNYVKWAELSPNHLEVV